MAEAPRVYLAGPIAGCNDAEAMGWREQVKAFLPFTLDPMARDYRVQEEDGDWSTTIVEEDKADIDACDIVLAYCPKPSVGTSMEILYAAERGKPCVAVVPADAPLSPWIRYHASIVVSTLEDAVAAILADISPRRLPVTHEDVQSVVHGAVLFERRSQEALIRKNGWSKVKHPWIWNQLILEELSEVGNAIIGWSETGDPTEREYQFSLICNEMVQVTALAWAALEQYMRIGSGQPEERAAS